MGWVQQLLLKHKLPGHYNYAYVGNKLVQLSTVPKINLLYYIHWALPLNSSPLSYCPSHYPFPWPLPYSFLPAPSSLRSL